MTLASLLPTLLTLGCTALLAPLCFWRQAARAIEDDSRLLDMELPPC